MELDIIQLIQNVGFPIAISIYLIVKAGKSDAVIERNTEALVSFKEVVHQCQKK